MSLSSCARKANLPSLCLRRNFASSSKGPKAGRGQHPPTSKQPPEEREPHPLQTVQSHATLPSAKMRALISLYHQAETWVTPETLLQRIDEAFVPDARTPSPPASYGGGVLREELDRIRSAPKMATWGLSPNQSHSYVPGMAWSEGRNQRELMVLEALYGTDRAVPGPTRPGLDLVQESGEDVKRAYIEDRAVYRGEALEKELDEEDDFSAGR